MSEDPKYVPAKQTYATVCTSGKMPAAVCIAAWEDLLRAQPQNAQAFANLGNAYLDNANASMAEKSYRRAIQLGLDNADTHFGLGVSLDKGKKQEEAIKEYEKAITLNPRMSAAYNNLGAVYEAKGNIDQAKVEYKKALELDPKNADAKQNLERYEANP
jgi:tetratricopeptide (TPR) repeat protein